MTSITVIIILLIALGITAGFLILVVIGVFLKKGEMASDTEKIVSRVLDGTPLPAFEINTKHKVIQWNIALEALSGIKKADMLGTDNQWKVFYESKRPVLANFIVDEANEETIFAQYGNKASKSPLIKGAYEAEDFFPAMGEKGKWYHFTASPIINRGVLVGAIEILEDVSDRHTAAENLRYHLGQVTKLQEEERKYLARELHDTTVQTLVALLYQIDNFLADKPDLTEGQVTKLKGMYQSLKRAVEDVRNFSRRLRPPVLDDLGLLPVLEWLTGEIKKSYNIDIGIEIVGEHRRLDPDLELTLFRIIQEAMINAGKYAKVESAKVTIEYLADLVRVEIADKGQGFDLPEKVGSLPREGKLGLAGIAERIELLSGKFEIKSTKGAGTTVVLEVPVK
ncbi:MAG: PAS domain-containing protein [Dehalococcoidia bacterium]|nr:MAG: PAS domain-containing protein [Dehalococcoidia bacterium]